jgi:DNA-3-methyladenine glycosylase
MNWQPLPESFYLQPTPEAARALLGHLLIREAPGGWVGGRIVETEAYLQDDPASHSYRGKRARNASMFGLPAHAYVYRSYGVHWCLNAVCQPEGVGEAVLIRALEPVTGLEWMRAQRGELPAENLCRGPGNLCKALGITVDLDGECLRTGQLLIVQGEPLSDMKRLSTPRIGISAATDCLWRFIEKGNRCVSRNRWKVNRNPHD